jgi:chemotaxis protein methyltransferase CheR
MGRSSVNESDFIEFLKQVLPLMGYRWRRFERRNVRRRIRTRMESLEIHEWKKYAKCVELDAAERNVLDYLLRLTITRFFRNAWLWPEAGSLIADIDRLLDGKEKFKVWSAGCASGEEPFSLAMLLDGLERSGRLHCPWTVLGTDTDAASLARTKAAGYRWGSVREVPRELLERWFREKDGKWFLDDEIRKMVTFMNHDLIQMNPPGRFHMVFLRNSILTYNTDEIQLRVLNRIRDCLLEPGYLVIGRTETLPEGAGFDQVSKCIYQLT